MMKKFLAMLAIAATMAGGMTSCDTDDKDEAMVLSGEWMGDFCMCYSTTNRRGETVWYDADHSRLYFEPAYNYATHGEGYQIDYYEYGPYESEYFAFKWRVNGGRIIINYFDNPDLDVCIRDYHLDNDYLTGTFTDTGKRFRLYKTFDHYDWTPYVNVDHYYRDRYGWDEGPRSRAAGEMQDEEDDNYQYPVIYHGPRPTAE